MKNWVDKLLLFFCCFTVYLCDPLFQAGVVPVIVAAAFSGLFSYFEEEKTRAALAGAFILWSVFLPGLAVFLPLVFYDMLFNRFRALCLLGFIPAAALWQSAKFTTGAFTALLFLLALWIQYRTAALERLYARYDEMRDSAKEMELLLKKQNSGLMEKQDYEINIATLNERNRIARDIHDNVGHLLSSSILQVGALLAVNRDEAVREGLLTVKDTLTSAMNSIRSSVHGLYDDSIDLYAQVRKLTDGFAFCPLSFDYDFHTNPEQKLKYALIAIVKEALSNIIRHSSATAASVTFREHPALYQLIIADNGTVKGYDPENGIGLKNIADRVSSFHGICNISTENGFQIFISVPKEREYT